MQTGDTFSLRSTGNLRNQKRKTFTKMDVLKTQACDEPYINEEEFERSGNLSDTLNGALDRINKRGKNLLVKVQRQ